MGSIFRDSERNFEIIQGENKSAFPDKRFLAPGMSHDDVDPGELVGLRAASSRQMIAEKITDANELDQAANAVMRINTTEYDVRESNAITCIDGFYLVRTRFYDPNETYGQGDLVTAAHVPELGGGAFAPVQDGTTKWAIGQIQSPPVDASEQTPMRLKVFGQPQDVTHRS